MTLDQDSNGWSEYRRMIISWHEDEVAARKEIQQQFIASNAVINAKLDSLDRSLGSLKHERRIVLVLMGIIAPILLSAVVSVAMGLK